jgi:toxin-antitoxin system PIN domain toxin
LILIDVNVLIYAHRADSSGHEGYRNWLTEVLKNDSPYGIWDLVLSAFLRIVTHPRIFQDPTPLETAFPFVNEIRDRPNCVLLSPGERHWDIFTHLSKTVGARGNLIPDAYLAALAIESGTELVTTDRDYARFPNLRWRHPLG